MAADEQGRWEADETSVSAENDVVRAFIHIMMLC